MSWSRRTRSGSRKRVRVRAARHGCLRREQVLRRSGRVREGVARGRPDPDHARPTAAPSRRRCTCCPRSGSATPGMAIRPCLEALAARGPRTEGHDGHRRDACRRSAHALAVRRRRRCRCCSPRTRRTPSGCSAGRIRRRSSRTASTTSSSHGRDGAVNRRTRSARRRPRTARP